MNNDSVKYRTLKHIYNAQRLLVLRDESSELISCVFVCSGLASVHWRPRCSKIDFFMEPCPEISAMLVPSRRHYYRML